MSNEENPINQNFSNEEPEKSDDKNNTHFVSHYSSETSLTLKDPTPKVKNSSQIPEPLNLLCVSYSNYNNDNTNPSLESTQYNLLYCGDITSQSHIYEEVKIVSTQPNTLSISSSDQIAGSYSNEYIDITNQSFESTQHNLLSCGELTTQSYIKEEVGEEQAFISPESNASISNSFPVSSLNLSNNSRGINLHKPFKIIHPISTRKKTHTFALNKGSDIDR